MIAKLTAANTMPIEECSASLPTPSSVRIESTLTYAANAKNENAMTRSATLSRRSGLWP